MNNFLKAFSLGAASVMLAIGATSASASSYEDCYMNGEVINFFQAPILLVDIKSVEEGAGSQNDCTEYEGSVVEVPVGGNIRVNWDEIPSGTKVTVRKVVKEVRNSERVSEDVVTYSLSR